MLLFQNNLITDWYFPYKRCVTCNFLTFSQDCYLCDWLSEIFAKTECLYSTCIWCIDISITKAHPFEGLTRGLASEINKNRGGLIWNTKCQSNLKPDRICYPQYWTQQGVRCFQQFFVLSKIASRSNTKEAEMLLQIESSWCSLSVLLKSKGENSHSTYWVIQW